MPWNESAQSGQILDGATLDNTSPGQTYALVGEVVNVRRSLQLIVDFEVTAVAGTAPTLDIKLQGSPDGVLWIDIIGAAFTQFTATGSQRVTLPDDDNTGAVFGPLVRLVAKVGGADHDFTCDCFITGKDVRIGT